LSQGYARLQARDDLHMRWSMFPDGKAVSRSEPG
jgi:hypothetical protein